MMAERWIIDVASVKIAGHTLYVAAVIDLDTREIICHDTSAFAGSAMLAAFGCAVFHLGAPELVVIDQGIAGIAVAQEAAKLGAEVRDTQGGTP